MIVLFQYVPNYSSKYGLGINENNVLSYGILSGKNVQSHHTSGFVKEITGIKMNKYGKKY